MKKQNVTLKFITNIDVKQDEVYAGVTIEDDPRVFVRDTISELVELSNNINMIIITKCYQFEDIKLNQPSEIIDAVIDARIYKGTLGFEVTPDLPLDKFMKAIINGETEVLLPYGNAIISTNIEYPESLKGKDMNTIHGMIQSMDMCYNRIIFRVDNYGRYMITNQLSCMHNIMNNIEVLTMNLEDENINLLRSDYNIKVIDTSIIVEKESVLTRFKKYFLFSSYQ